LTTFRELFSKLKTFSFYESLIDEIFQFESKNKKNPNKSNNKFDSKPFNIEMLYLSNSKFPCSKFKPATLDVIIESPKLPRAKKYFSKAEMISSILMGDCVVIECQRKKV
jgi:hypothetical protein